MFQGVSYLIESNAGSRSRKKRTETGLIKVEVIGHLPRVISQNDEDESLIGVLSRENKEVEALLEEVVLQRRAEKWNGTRRLVEKLFQ